MSLFYYFISHKPLPNLIVEQFHSNHYSIDDVTQYVKDAKKEHYYYDCNPYAIYIDEDEYDINEIISNRQLQDNILLLNISYEFSNLGNFQFIKMWEDNTRCDTGYHEAFFQKCRQDYMLFSDFCEALENKEEGITTDIYYTIKVTNE